MQGVPFENFQHQNDFSSEIVQFFWEEKPIYKKAIISRTISKTYVKSTASLLSILDELQCHLLSRNFRSNQWRIKKGMNNFSVKSTPKKSLIRLQQFLREFMIEEEDEYRVKYKIDINCHFFRENSSIISHF